MIKNIVIIIGDITRSAGTERAVTNLSNMLTTYGDYRVTIISLYSKKGSKCYYELNCDVEIINLELSRNTFCQKFISYLLYIKKVKVLLKEKQIDFVLATNQAYNSLLVFFGKKVKKIACEHMNYASCGNLWSKIRFFCYRKLDAVVLLTKSDAKHYSFIKKSKVFVIPNSLSFTCEKPAKLKNKMIIAIGRLCEQKGFDMLIEAAIKIKSKVPDWHINVYGDGEDKEYLLTQINNNDLSDFITINQPITNVKDKLLDSSVYVMTSRWEGFGLVLLEAKTCGLPCVSFDCPEGPADLIENDKDGYLVPLGNINELANKVIELCKNFELRKQMGKQSYINSENFKDTKIYSKWNSLFQKLY